MVADSDDVNQNQDAAVEACLDEMQHEPEKEVAHDEVQEAQHLSQAICVAAAVAVDAVEVVVGVEIHLLVDAVVAYINVGVAIVDCSRIVVMAAVGSDDVAKIGDVEAVEAVAAGGGAFQESLPGMNVHEDAVLVVVVVACLLLAYVPVVVVVVAVVVVVVANDDVGSHSAE